MLSDREKFIAHYLSVLIVGIMDDVERPAHAFSKTIEKLRKARVRNLKHEDVQEIMDDLNEEFLMSGSFLNLEHKYRDEDELK